MVLIIITSLNILYIAIINYIVEWTWATKHIVCKVDRYRKYKCGKSTYYCATYTHEGKRYDTWSDTRRDTVRALKFKPGCVRGDWDTDWKDYSIVKTLTYSLPLLTLYILYTEIKSPYNTLIVVLYNILITIVMCISFTGYGSAHIRKKVEDCGEEDTSRV